MTTDVTAIGEIDPANSVVFLGSGFSLGATNIAGGNPPNGSGLRRHFIANLGLPDNTSYDLQVLTEEFAERDAELLHQELYRIFRITELSDAQVAILNEPWRRIYTTNYDDSVELHRIRLKRPVNTFDVSGAVPSKLPDGGVVHLHGSIREVTPENVLSSIVLGEASYVRTYLERSLWYDQFQRDLRFATQLFIIGYSMADYHIAALLLADPALAARTFFIQGHEPDPVLLRRTKDYGRTLFIGADGFAEALRALPRSGPLTDVSRLKGFRSLSPLRDRKVVAQPTASEVFDLLVYGKFNNARLARSLPNETYAIARAERVAEAAGLVESNRSVVVESRLGNGKTLFLHLLAYELTARGYSCFMYRPDAPDFAREIDVLRSLDRVAIFVDHYSTAQDVLQVLGEALSGAKFVVEIRTAIFEVRFHELAKTLPHPYGRASLNQLYRSENSALARLCSKAGLSVPLDAADRSKELRDILLELFSNEAIRAGIERTLQPIFQSRSRRRVLVMAMLIAGTQGAVDPSFIRTVVGVDPFAEFKPVEELAGEVFEVSSDDFRARSSIFSEFVVDAFLQPDEIADCVVEVTLAAAQRKTVRRYRILMSSMMAYGNLRRMLHRRADVVMLIINVYERLRHDDRISDEPLFWLQYAIAMSELPRLDAAWEYIGTAYRSAAQRPGFQTYQIDTQALRIALLLATGEDAGRPVSHLQEVLDGLERINDMLSEDSHRAYAIKVLEGIPQFVTARRVDMSVAERSAIVFWLNTVARSLAVLPAEFKAISGSEVVRRGLDGAIQSITSLVN
ncbi:MAG TPA: SIR2 family protein [Bradyrhizobium sp.]|nr:SIR2 family protein [Bradyrhizobium sp.]